MLRRVKYPRRNSLSAWEASAHETLCWLGLFGVVINGAQLVILERNELLHTTWDRQVVEFTLGFDFTMVLLYSLAPFLFRWASAAFYNMSILTSDFYGLVFGIYLFDYKVSYKYVFWRIKAFVAFHYLVIICLCVRSIRYMLEHTLLLLLASLFTISAHTVRLMIWPSYLVTKTIQVNIASSSGTG